MLIVLQRSLQRRYSRMLYYKLGHIAKFNGDSRLVNILVNLVTMPLICLI